MSIARRYNRRDCGLASLGGANSIANTSVTTELSTLTGQTATAFDTVWHNYAKGQSEIAKAAHTVAGNLNTIADKIDEAHRKYEGIMAGLAVGATVGIVVGIFTFGIGAAAADSAAVLAASGLIASLLEMVGAEFTAFTEAGTSIGAGDGLNDMSVKGIAEGAAAGGALGGLLKAIDAGLLVKALIGGTGSAAITTTLSEINDGKMPSVGELLASTLLGSLAGGVDSALDSGAGKVAQEVSQQQHLALDFAALYKDDPTSLVALKDDPYQSDDIRLLASQYHDLFEADPKILTNIPSLATLLNKDPEAITQVLRANHELTAIASERGMSPTQIKPMLEAFINQKDAIGVTNDDLKDFVVKWQEESGKVGGDLRQQLVTVTP